MKGLLWFIRNNQIIYKVSIVSILILMLISVVQINPENENKKNVGAETVIDYTIRYRSAEHKFYKVKDDIETEMISVEMDSLGLQLSSTYYELSEGRYNEIKLNNANILTTEAIALEVIGNVCIWVNKGTVNKLKSSYNKDADGYFGIKVIGSLLIGGIGELEANCNNMDLTGDKMCCAIYTSRKFDITYSTKATVIAKAKGRNGVGIYSGTEANIASATMKIYGGNSGNTAAIFANEYAELWDVNSYLESSSEDGFAHSMLVGSEGNGEIWIGSGIFESKISSKKGGAVLQSGKVTVRRMKSFAAYINGKNVSGVKSIGNKDNTDNSIIINGDANVSIAGDIHGQDCAALYADNSNINLESGQVNINLKNTTDNNKIVGIYATNDRILTNGNMTVASGRIMSRVICDNGVGIDVAGNMNVQGGNVVACGEGRAINYNSLLLNSDMKPYTEVISAATDVDGNSVVDYDFANLSTYKHIEIGKIYDYSLKFDAGSGTLHKVYSEDEVLSEENKIDNSELSGWEIVNESGNNVLVLKGLNFITNKPNALMLVCNDDNNSSIRLQEGTSNRLGVVNKDDSIICGIKGDKNLEILGEGELDITINGTNEGVGIWIGYTSGAGNLKVDSSRIRIVERVESFGWGLYTYGAIDITNSELEMDIVSNGIKGIFVSRINENDINIQNSKLNMNFTSGTNDIYGIHTVHNITFFDSDIKFILNSEGSCYGIWGMEEDKTLRIIDGTIDIDIQTVETGCAISFGKLEVTGGNNTFKIKGANFGYSLYCYNLYNQTDGRVVIDSENIDGLHSLGAITLDDGTLDITSPVIMNKVPTINNNNVFISEYIDKSDPTNTVKYTGANINNIATYRHIVIEPNYFLQYSSGKLYKCKNITDELNSTNEYSNSSITIDGTNNIITLDGFEFTTSSKIGLYTTEKLTINLVENSKNSISMNYIGTEDSNVISSTNAITISGTGELDIKSNATSSINRGIYVTNNLLTVNNATVNVSCNGKNSYGISAANDVNISSANLTIDAIAQTGDVAGIISNDTNVTLENSYCKINSEVIDNGTSCFGIKADDVININESEFNGEIVSNKSKPRYIYNGINYYSGGYTYACLYSNGVNLPVDNTALKIKDSNIVINGSVNDGYGIYTYEGNIVVDGGNVDIKAMSDNVEDINRTSYCGIQAEVNLYVINSEIDIYGNTKYYMTGVHSRLGIMSIDNSMVNIKIIDGSDLNKGINAYRNSIIINLSQINISVNNGVAIGMYESGKKLDIINSDLDIEISKNDASLLDNYGLYSSGDINVDNTSVNMKIFMKSGKGMYSYGNLTISNVKKCNINVNGTTEGYGIYSGASINIIDTDASIWATTKAIDVGSDSNFIFDNDGDMVSRVVEASEVYKDKISDYVDSDFEKYIPKSFICNDLKQYKYIKIGQVPTYYYRFNSANGGEMWKVPKTGSPVNITNSNTPDSGWTIENGILKLDDFSHITTAEIVLDIVGNANIEVTGNNTLQSIYNTASKYYGIYGNGNITFTGSGTMNISALNEYYKNSNNKYYGIYTNYIDGQNDNKDITITNGVYNITAKENKFYGISGKDISTDSATININAKVNSGSGIYAYGNMIIKDNSNIKVTNTNGMGIYSENKLEIINSDIISRAEVGAIISYANDYIIPGIIKASDDYNANVNNLGTLSLGQYKEHMATTPYKCVYITNIYDIISVDITWSDMSYAYSPGTWNPDTHSFIDNGWTPKTTDGGKITVSNSGSNMPIKAIISYDKGGNINSSNNNSNNNSDSNNSNGNLGIDGKLVVYDEEKNVINEGSVLDKKLIVRDSFITYLQLIEEPKELFERTSVGNITVTITE